MEPNDRKLEEIYKLEKENNRMLHAMRRQAFLGAIFRIFMYALALGVPIWLFFTYMMPVLESFDKTASQFGIKTNFGEMFGNYGDAFKDLQGIFNGKQE